MPCFGRENGVIKCPVVLLDDTEIAVEVKENTRGQEILDQVFNRINLLEKDYFGLRFLDQCDEARWLDPEKCVLKQNPKLSMFYFGVRFYSSDPCKLQEELTRYLFYQQLKKDILQSRLHCSFTVATRLFAYVVQAELGDFDPKRHTLGYVSEFRFMPNQSEEMEARTEEIHKTLTNMVPVDCELEFLDKAKWLDFYGADIYHVRGDDGVDYEFGLQPSGLLVKKRGNIIGNYVWPKISKLYFKGKKFHLSVWGKNEKEDCYTFVLPRKSSCKNLWKNCVEHHAFFRLEKNNHSGPQMQRYFHFGSKHRYSGRTQHEALSESMRRKRQAPVVQRPFSEQSKCFWIALKASRVNRKPSKKYPRRSFQERRKATPSNHHNHHQTTAHYTPTGHSKWSNHDTPISNGGILVTNGTGGLYTSGERLAQQGSHLAKFPRPHRRGAGGGAMSGSDNESSRRRRGHRSYVSDDESEVRRRRHRRRRNNRGYASAGDASGTETEGYIERHKQSRNHKENEDPYDSTAQWVDSTHNLHQIPRERQGRSYEDVRARQHAVYKSETDILLTPALIPVQKSSVSVARVREDRNNLNPNRYSTSNNDSLYKVRSESANNKLNFRVLLELGPDSGLPTQNTRTSPKRMVENGHEKRNRHSQSPPTPRHHTRSGNHIEASPQKRHTHSNGYSSRSSPRKSPVNNQFHGMKSTQL